ncbi:hypothetical protein N403_01825 [Helicobacter pylori FD430]|nr:hypothetical protein [Helicobacter pylori]EQL51181.1 hypothetical protein N403_01825 [Helicobacter pylori FD430]
MIGVGDYTYLYLKNLYFKSLRRFGGCIALIHDLINILSSKTLIFNKRFGGCIALIHDLINILSSKTLIFNKKLNLLEK